MRVLLPGRAVPGIFLDKAVGKTVAVGIAVRAVIVVRHLIGIIAAVVIFQEIFNFIVVLIVIAGSAGKHQRKDKNTAPRIMPAMDSPMPAFALPDISARPLERSASSSPRAPTKSDKPQQTRSRDRIPSTREATAIPGDWVSL